jgi:hypothetical protein
MARRHGKRCSRRGSCFFFGALVDRLLSGRRLVWQNLLLLSTCNTMRMSSEDFEFTSRQPRRRR